MPLQSFRTALTIRVAVVIALTMSIVALFTRLQVGNTERELSNRFLRQTTALVDGQIGGLLQKTKNQAELLAIVNRPSPVEAVRLDRAAQSMVDLLTVNEELGSLSLVLDRDGRYVRVVQKPSGEMEVTEATYAENARRVTLTYRPYADELREVARVDGWADDMRLEKSYQETRAAPGSNWSEHGLDGEDGADTIPGFTIGVPLTDSKGGFLGVVRATLTVTNLSKFLQKIPVGQRGYAVLLDMRDGQAVRVVAVPDAGRILVSRDARQRLASVAELDQPELERLVRDVSAAESLSPNEVVRYAFDVRRVSYTAAVQRLSDDQLPPWAVAVIAPSEEFSTSSALIVRFFVTFIVLALGVGILISMVMARRISRPLVRLVSEAQNIQALKLDPTEFAPTNIREIDELAGAMQSMKTSLRSLEKLVPAEYARWLISSGQEAKLGGERRRITTYFGDIIGFTSLSHDLAPEDLMKVLTEYLDLLSNEVLAHGGTIDKFNGDDIMAFWGAPTSSEDHAVMACRSALASLAAVRTMHQEWSDHGRPLLGASFGIATGDVIVGNVGNRQRMNYTVIGDSVNMASRLQGLNKFLGTLVLVSSATQAEAGEQVVTRWVDRVRVAGRNEAEDVYELLAVRAGASDRLLECEALHDLAKAAYLNCDWDTAEGLLRQVMASDPHDGPASVLVARVYELRQSPPANGWDGSHAMPGK